MNTSRRFRKDLIRQLRGLFEEYVWHLPDEQLAAASRVMARLMGILQRKPIRPDLESVLVMVTAQPDDTLQMSAVIRQFAPVGLAKICPEARAIFDHIRDLVVQIKDLEAEHEAAISEANRFGREADLAQAEIDATLSHDYGPALGGKILARLKAGKPINSRFWRLLKDHSVAEDTSIDYWHKVTYPRKDADHCRQKASELDRQIIANAHLISELQAIATRTLAENGNDELAAMIGTGEALVAYGPDEVVIMAMAERRVRQDGLNRPPDLGYITRLIATALKSNPEPSDEDVKAMVQEALAGDEEEGLPETGGDAAKKSAAESHQGDHVFGPDPTIDGPPDFTPDIAEAGTLEVPGDDTGNALEDPGADSDFAPKRADHDLTFQADSVGSVLREEPPVEVEQSGTGLNDKARAAAAEAADPRLGERDDSERTDK